MFKALMTPDFSRSESSQLRAVLRSTYRRIHPVLPGPMKDFTTSLDVAWSSRPRICLDRELHPAGRLPRGVVTVSLDFEMAWGWQYANNPNIGFEDLGLVERRQVPLILARMEEYSFPATWATVGHLFLESCTRGNNGLAHPEMPRLSHFSNRNWAFTSGDWYQHDPCSDVRKSPAWYAPDLVGMILGSRAGHELACHTFSHAGFGSYAREEVVEAEIDACVSAMKKYGVRPTTLVFPGNDVGHFDVLARRGVRIVRSFPVPGGVLSIPIRRSDGLWAVHTSSAVDHGGTWSTEQRFARLKRYADTAARRRLAMHLWLHPSLGESDMTGVLFPFLRYCAGLREKGVVDILTMEGLVEATGRVAGGNPCPS